MKDGNDEQFLLGNVTLVVKSFFAYLGKRWWMLLLIVCVGAGLGAVFFYLQQPRYAAVSTFILEEKSASGGGLAGLANQFGLNLGSLGGGGGLFAGDNILEILKSKKVVEKVLLSKVEPANTDGQTLADVFLRFSGKTEKWQKMPQLAGLNFRNASVKQLSPIQDSVLAVVYENIIKKHLSTERTSKQGTIIKVQVTAPEGLFARLMTERLVEEASRMYLDLRVGTGEENIRQLQRRSDSLLVLLNNKSYRAAASQPLDINPGIRTAIVPVEIANRDKTVLATLYAEVTKNLEASKLLLSQQTPVIQLLDSPGLLLNDQRKGMIFFLLAGSLAAAFLFVLSAFGAFCFWR